MTGPVRIALIGDYHPHVKAHVAVPAALALAAADLVCKAEPLWIPTPSLDHSAE